MAQTISTPITVRFTDDELERLRRLPPHRRGSLVRTATARLLDELERREAAGESLEALLAELAPIAHRPGRPRKRKARAAA